MQVSLQPSPAERVTGLWSTLQGESELIVSEDEVHWLRALALASDDDLVSHLLLRKLRVAKVVTLVDLPPDVVSLNSFVHFTFDGGPERFAQLLHPSPHMPAYGLSVVSLTGAGLIGLSEGQSMKWPGPDGELGELRVVHVDNDPASSPARGSGIR